MEYPRFRFSIDRGGTFTDVYAQAAIEKGAPWRSITMKLLSNDTSYRDAAFEGILRIVGSVRGVTLSRETKLDPKCIDWIRLGSTIATNALLEGNGVEVAAFVTRGFKDVLTIGTQARNEIFDLQARKTEVVCKHILEVDERVLPITKLTEQYLGDAHEREYQTLDECYNDVDDPQQPTLDKEDFDVGVLSRSSKDLSTTAASTSKGPIIDTEIGTKYLIIGKLNIKAVRSTLKNLYEQNPQLSIAIALMHSYGFKHHEELLEKLSKEAGFQHVFVSHKASASNLYYPRASTNYFDASLTPLIRSYLEGFVQCFTTPPNAVHFMQSDGGLVSYREASGVRSVFSGPAGGVIGYTQTAYTAFRKMYPVIGFDMGGTSTDVSRFGGTLDISTEGEISGFPLHVPHLAIRSVAAGGGSMLFFRGGMFVVGPQSAGANPGPACYRNDGPLTVTDANVVLGRIRAQFLPHVFGPSKCLPIDIDASFTKMQKLTDVINKFNKENQRATVTLEEVALGYVRVANEAMTRPILSITREKGFDASSHILSCFGGAGGLHACQIAKSLGIHYIHIHKYAGILSAYGLSLADVQLDESMPLSEVFPSNTSNITKIEEINAERALSKIAQNSSKQRDSLLQRLEEKGYERNSIEINTSLSMRYEGSDTNIHIPLFDSTGANELIRQFVTTHREELGFEMKTPLVAEQLRSVGTGKERFLSEDTVAEVDFENKRTAHPFETLDICFEQSNAVISKPQKLKTNLYLSSNLNERCKIGGPALICDTHTIILVEPGWSLYVQADGSFVLSWEEVVAAAADVKPDVDVSPMKPLMPPHNTVETMKPDAVTLAVMGHRFMGIAEQMGKVLQRVAVSPNIKQRLDFSCAIFRDDGSLVANAPHIPVHLGAMGETVRWQVEYLGDTWDEEDVILVNHTANGGSHLPDLTVISPVFADVDGVRKRILYVASRGHHVDVGGITPGSMPCFSKTIHDEGAAIRSFKLVAKGVFQTEATAALFGHRLPNCTNEEHAMFEKQAREHGNVPPCPAARCLDDNLNDLRAQVAANKKGIALLQELIKTEGLSKVLFNTQHLQEVSAESVRELIFKVQKKLELTEDVTTVHACDYLDDGTPIDLMLTLSKSARSLVFDFSNSGPQIYGNLNTPRAVVKSAVMYCLRCLINEDIPLNEGFLIPVKVVFAENSVLSPSEDAAVVAGNVNTSQRITDVIFQAFEAVADSQGCMNNLTFGKEGLAFYETIAGGGGAGHSWNGTCAVQSHMTNTRVTDSELIERKFPVMLHAFQLRLNSGGKGRYTGGDGVYREFEFLIDGLTVNLVTERRTRPPRGLKGGRDGKVGKNLWLRMNKSSADDGTSKAHIYQLLTVGGKNQMAVSRGDRLAILTPGGGGYGMAGAS